jgi:hypothetical protein
MELKDSNTIAYSAEPQVLTISLEEMPKTGFGCAKGQFWMADDFDATLDCFKEYM